jgi:hypothetical protein
MEAAAPRPAQTLHGYARGHRLLARGGDLSEAEMHELDRLSDLSGYLPADAHFDAYHTGFPCGRYYALACTWPDHDAPRRGTVLTHTLLIPLDHWSADPDPFRWLTAHRRPADAHDIDPYTAPPTPPSAYPPADAPSSAALRGLLHLWFSQGERPILWLDERPPLDLVRALWPWLWSELRAPFAFCTFALQPRSLRGRPFDFLGVPPPALGAFHELARSPAWWRSDRPGLAPDPWLDNVLAGGPEALAAHIERCRATGLGPPAGPGLVRATQRFMELADGARTRLPAARARLDMLLRGWPAAAPTHPEVIAAIDHLIARQADAPLDPRPLWDLEHMLTSAPVQEHLADDTPVGARVLICVKEQVEYRLRSAGDRCTDGLVRLYMAALPARDAIRQAISAVGTSGNWVDSMLDLAVALADHALERAIMANMPTPTLARWIARQIQERSSDADSLRTRALDLAIHRRSPEIAFAAWAGDTPHGLAAAASVVEHHPASAPNFEALLADQPEDQRLAWCLDCPVERLQGLAVDHAVDLLGATRPTVARLAELCEGHLQGAAIFARVCTSAYDRELTEALKAHPVLALDLIMRPLQSATWPSATTSAAIRAIPPERLWCPPLHIALTRSSVTPTHSGVQALVQRLLGDLASDSIDPEEAGGWLATLAIAGALQTAPPWDIERPFVSHSPDILRRVIQATARVRDLTTELGPVRPLGLLLARVWGDQLAQNTPALLGLLPVPAPKDRGDILLRAEILGAVRISPPEGAWRLVERCFHPVYSATLAGSPTLASVTWRQSLPPDAARYWRHWLLDTWCDRRWPTESFITCLAGDLALAARLFKRAAKQSRTTHAFLVALRGPLRHEPGLTRLWSSFID